MNTEKNNNNVIYCPQCKSPMTKMENDYICIGCELGLIVDTKVPNQRKWCLPEHLKPTTNQKLFVTIEKRNKNIVSDVFTLLTKQGPKKFFYGSSLVTREQYGFFIEWYKKGKIIL